MNGFYFNHKATKFDLKNALRLAEASLLAYRAERTVKAEAQNQWGFDRFKFFDVYPTEAFIAADKNVIIVAFRGTEPKSFQDWLSDAQTRLIKGYLGKNHQGFLTAYQRISGELYATLNRFQDNNQTLWLTGHSLGAALATLAVADLGEMGRTIHGLYTFGQPRVGDQVFAREFDSRYKRKTFRFINNEDIVTRVPPRLMGYEHIGHVVYFDNRGKSHKDVRWWRMFLDSLTSTSARALSRYYDLKKEFPNGLEDHGMDKYILKIRENLYARSKK